MAKNVIVSQDDAAKICRFYEEIKRYEKLFTRSQSGSFMKIVIKSANHDAVVRAFERMKARSSPEPEKPETAEPGAE